MGIAPFAGVAEAASLQVMSETRRRKIAEAIVFLHYRLALHPRLAADLLLEARTAGIVEGTLYYAKRHLGVQSRRHGYGGQWSWILPATRNTSEQPLS